MAKNFGLEQNEKGLEQSNPTFIILPLWREAKAISELKNLLNDSQEHKTSDMYNTLLNFEAKKADKKSVYGRKLKIHNS